MPQDAAAVARRGTISLAVAWPWLVFLSLLALGFFLDWRVYYALEDIPRPRLGVMAIGVLKYYGNTNIYFMIIVPLVLALGYALKDSWSVFTGKSGCVGGAATATLTQLLKYSMGRARPREVEYHDIPAGFHGPSLHFHSFPSGDVSAAFCFAYIMGYYAPVLRWPLYLIAAAIGFERMVLKAHYTSDVIAGAGVGILAGWIAVRVVVWWDVRRASRRGESADE